MDGYCVKCKQKKEMIDTVLGKTSKGGNIVKGKCSECGCNMAKIISAEQAKQMEG